LDVVFDPQLQKMRPAPPPATDNSKSNAALTLRPGEKYPTG
jgi:hypothetical protein